LVGAALLAAARLVPASGDTPPPAPDLPHFVCAGLIDDEGDNTAPKYAFGEDTSTVVPKRSAMDIRTINLRLTPTQLQVFMSLTGDPTTASMTAEESAWRYAVTFNIDTISFTYGLERDNTADPGKDAKPADAGQYNPKAAMTGLIVIPDSTAKFVPGTGTNPSWVVFTSPRAAIEKQMGPIDPGTKFTAISGAAYDYLLNQSGTADTTSATGPQAEYVAGDDSCFGPPATSITSLAAPAVEYNHTSKLSATLLDKDGKPLAGKPMTFTVQDGKPTKLSATTNASGVATASYLAKAKAGTYPVTATFAGEPSVLKTSSMSGTIKVSAEKTAFTAPSVAKPSSQTRIVTTILRGDNNVAIAGVNVDWYVNGKKVATIKTDKTGKVSYRGAKPGQSVQARFAGTPGMLLASVSRIVKA
jgi:hypothetical protein